jgi:hypothetical protein
MGGRNTTTPGGLYPDEARYLDTADGSAFLSLYMRHRDGVRAELEAAGLSTREAEARINEVFVWMMDGRSEADRSRPLADTLRDLARVVAEIPGDTWAERAGKD